MRRSRNRRKSPANITKRKKSRVIRYSTNKRPYTIALPQRISLRNNSLISKIVLRIPEPSTKWKKPLGLIIPQKRKKKPCIEKQRIADQTRRRAFFKSRSRGSSAQRPDHNRKHKRC